MNFVVELDGLLESNIQLFDDLGSLDKIFLRIAGASHFMQWERGRHIKRKAVLEFLKNGTLRGATRDRFRADENGLFSSLWE